MFAPALTIEPTQLTTAFLASAQTPQADADRKNRQHEAWKSYRGEFQRALNVSANQPDDNVLTNRCAPIVDKGVSFLFGKVLKIECTDGGDDEQDFIDGLWGDDDDKMTLLSQIAINGGVCGSPFVKIIPPQGRMQYPRIVVLDPMLVRVVTNEDDCSTVQAYIIEYASTGDLQKKEIILRKDPDGLADIAGEADLDDTWTITKYQRRGQGNTGANSWEQVGESVEWPYPFPPVLSCQNLPNPNEFWGQPDLTPDLINMNRVLNFVQSNTSRIIKYHAHPKTWIKGARAEQIQIAVDDIICFQSPDAEINTVEMHSDLSSSLNFIANIRSDMDEQSRVPAVALGRMVDMPKGNISGVALQLLFQPLLEKTTIKQRLYGKLIREICRAALVIMGKISIEEWEDYSITLNWQTLLPVDDLAAAQTAQVLQGIGVSQSTLLQQLGYDPDDEADRKADEDEQTLTKFSQGKGLPPSPQRMQQDQQTIQQDSQAQQKAGMGQS